MQQFKRYNGQTNARYQSGYNATRTVYGSGKQYQPQTKKRSGAKHVSNGKKDGGTNVSAWNMSKEKGFVSMLIFPTKYSDQATKSGGTKLCAKVTFKRTGETKLLTAVQSTKNDKIYIPSLGWVVNPKAPNGGYCGQSRRP